MKRNKWLFPVVLAILAVLVFSAVFSCDTGGGGTSGPSESYFGEDTAGKQYVLIVTGKKFELKIDEELVCTGIVSKNGNTGIWTLMPYGYGGQERDDFDITIVETDDGPMIADIGGDKDGKITNNVKGTKIPVVAMVPPKTGGSGEPGDGEDEEEGPWIWYAMDDSVPNDYLDVQTVFAPGGVSRITNTTKVTNPDGTKGQKPYKYPEGTVTDNDGKTINETVFNFKGNTKVSRDNRDPNEAARFPMVGWGAKPSDAATLADLRKAKGYSFWVRLNSSTGNNWTILSAVDSGFDQKSPNDIEKGFDYGHWFGNKVGGSADGYTGMTANFTGGLDVGKWHKITVVMSASGRNIEQAHWIWQYNNENKRVFNQNKAEQIQWQIPLQYQKDGGTNEAERSSDPYDVIKGSYDFNIDFYGFELTK
jgi:hypothetical protein